MSDLTEIVQIVYARGRKIYVYNSALKKKFYENY